MHGQPLGQFGQGELPIDHRRSRLPRVLADGKLHPNFGKIILRTLFSPRIVISGAGAFIMGGI